MVRTHVPGYSKQGRSTQCSVEGGVGWEDLMRKISKPDSRLSYHPHLPSLLFLEWMAGLVPIIQIHDDGRNMCEPHLQ